MKVSELRDFLNYIDGDLEVIVSSDVDGDEYHPLGTIEFADYTSFDPISKDPSYGGWVKEFDENDERLDQHNSNAIVLYPVL